MKYTSSGRFPRPACDSEVHTTGMVAGKEVRQAKIAKSDSSGGKVGQRRISQNKRNLI